MAMNLTGIKGKRRQLPKGQAPFSEHLSKNDQAKAPSVTTAPTPEPAKPVAAPVVAKVEPAPAPAEKPAAPMIAKAVEAPKVSAPQPVVEPAAKTEVKAKQAPKAKAKSKPKQAKKKAVKPTSKAKAPVRHVIEDGVIKLVPVAQEVVETDPLKLTKAQARGLFWGQKIEETNKKSEGVLVKISDISVSIGHSDNYLGKLFRELKAKGMLELESSSHRYGGTKVTLTEQGKKALERATDDGMVDAA